MRVRKTDDIARVESGQRNKQGGMKGEANQLYRRPQMTGQAMGSDEEDHHHHHHWAAMHSVVRRSIPLLDEGLSVPSPFSTQLTSVLWS